MSVIQKLDSQSSWSQVRVSPTSQIPAELSPGDQKVEADLRANTRAEFNLEELNEEQKEKFTKELEKLNESIESSGKMLRFKYNDEIKQYYVEVLNAKTQEVVASLPPEFLIDLSIKMKELIGLFIDERM